MVGMNHRFRSDVQAVRGFLAGGDIGPLQAVRSGWYTFQPPRQLAGWRVRRQEAGGGAFLELGLQLLDLGLWLSGWPAAPRVTAPPPRDQLALHRVLEAIYRSADEGRDVAL